MSISVAIDGPSGAGKSTLARRLAAEMGFVYVDTGAMYRSIGLYALESGTDPHDAAGVEALLPQIRLEARPVPGGQQMLLNGRDVTEQVRREEVGMAASAVSALPAVRAFLLEKQRQMAASQNVLMDGRDIASKVLPHADTKIYLTASVEERAHRRANELREKGETCDIAEVEAEIRARDDRDMHRQHSPLIQVPEAVLVDSSTLTIDETIDRILEICMQH